MVESIVQSHPEIFVGSDEKKLIRVLHVDDELGLLKVAKQCLESEGMFQVDSVTSVEEALAMLQKEQYDAIISDYQMPGTNGLQFLKELREKGNNIPFIMFTGKGREEIASKALNLGADHYLSKTGDPEIAYSELSREIANAVKTRHAEQELCIQREELLTILDSLPLQIWYKDKDNRLLRVNKRFAEYMGVSKRDLEGKSLGDIFPPDVARKCWEEDKEVIETGQPNIDILDCHESAQGLRWFLTSKVPYKDADGKIIGTINFSSDITERKKAEKETESMAKFPEQNPEPVLRIGSDGKLLYANQACQNMLREGQSKKIGTLIETLRRHAADALSSNEHSLFEEEHDGKTFRFNVIPVASERYANLYATDITDRKKNEKLIIESQQKFEGLFTYNPEATVHLNRDFHILDANPRFMNLFGYSLEEIKDKPINCVIVPKNLIEEAEMLDMKAIDGYVYDTIRARKDGSLVAVSISAAPILIEGQVAGYIGVYKDISELKKTEHQLAMMNEKLRVVGGLTRHDVRNKLSTITGNAYLLKEQLADNEEVLDKIRDRESRFASDEDLRFRQGL